MGGHQCRSPLVEGGAAGCHQNHPHRPIGEKGAWLGSLDLREQRTGPVSDSCDWPIRFEKVEL